jgi:hypothetical protein
MNEGQRREQAREFLAEHPETAERLRASLVSNLSKAGVELDAELITELIEMQVAVALDNVDALLAEFFPQEHLKRYVREGIEEAMDPETKVASVRKVDELVSERMRHDLRRHLPKHLVTKLGPHREQD